MVLLEFVDLRVHHGENHFIIPNIDPDRYSYIELLDDVLNKLVKGNGGVGFSIDMQYAIPGVRDLKPITSDKEMLEMFKVNDPFPEIKLYVKFTNIGGPLCVAAPDVPISQVTQLTPNDRPSPPEYVQTHYDNVHLRRNAENMYTMDDGVDMDVSDEVVSGDGEKYSSEEEGDSYCVNSSSAEFGAAMEGNNDSESGDGSEHLLGLEGEEVSRGGLSDFEEQYDEMGIKNGSDSEIEEVYIDKGIGGKPFVRERDGKVTLEAGLLFIDVHEFRAILRDFVIQEGFGIVRIKNEKARVTAFCVAHGCTWRIHASPTPDGKIYKIKTYTP